MTFRRFLSQLLRRLPGAFLLALCCSVATSAPAYPPAPLLSDYTHTAWGGLQAAPVDVLKFAQDADGWLWIATATGLYRYDGVQFERTDSVHGHRLFSSDVLGLMAARDGALWVGYRLGGVTVVRKDGARTFLEADGLPGGAVFHIEAAPDGTVWVATRDGLASLAPGAARFVRQADNVGLPGKRLFQVLFARDGTQWVAALGGAFFRKPGQQRFTQAWPRITLMSMAEGPDGAIWAADSGNNYYRLRTTQPDARDAPRAELKGTGLRFDRDGYLWLLQADAVERARDPAGRPLALQRLTQATGMSGALPQAFFQDREGTIWIGTTAGLDRLRRNRLRTLPPSEQYDRPGLVAGPDGGIWIGDFTGPVRSYGAKAVGKPVLDRHFSASHWAPDGALWIGDDRGLWRRAPDGRESTLAPPPGIVSLDPQAIQQDRSGALWVSYSGGGLFQWRAGSWLREGGLAGFPAELATSMSMDAQGRVWMGHARNHISLVADGRVTSLGAGAGLDLGTVLALVRDGDSMWAGGERGTSLYRDGRFLSLGGQRGEAFRGVSGIVRLPDGALWLHGADGIYHIGAASLAAWLRDPSTRVAFERFDALDGLRGHAPQLRPLPSLARAPDGQLWFSTGSGVALIDPARIPRNALAPPVAIRALSAEGRQYLVRGGMPVVLPTGIDSMQVAFTALSLSMPERVRFRYRLEGVDHGWQEPVGRREAHYTNLAPGTYRFQVSAANEDGVWNEQGAQLDVTIVPTFVQTPWFLLLAVLAGALLLYTLYALRIRYLTQRMHERLQERLAERSRIARSLHDTLLQGVQGVLMSFQAHAHRIPEGSTERERLDHTLDLAGRLLVEGRDSILDLRAASSPEELALALREFGGELALYCAHGFEMHVGGKPQRLAGQVTDEIYAIGREALFNASRYAHASTTILELDYGRAAFTLRVRDDGCGLDAAVAQAGQRPGHWGLVGMRERAASIGAQLALASQAGEGTTVEVRVPAALAYPPTLCSLWRRLLHKLGLRGTMHGG